MNVQKRNDVKIYNLSSGPTLPEWLGERARRNLSKRDEQVRRRIELIQDFQMPSSSNKVIQSKDGRYIMVGGTYAPRIRCYDLSEVSMKFERYVNSEIIDITMLGEDYGKMALLLDDRTVNFHAHYGTHESIRIPKFGRAMTYESTTCELLVAASGPHVYRINLEEGRFHQPWDIYNNKNNSTTSSDMGASSIAVSGLQPLVSVGCEDGIIRFWDNRSSDTLLHPFLKLNVKSATKGYGFFDEEENNVNEALYGSQRNPYEITSIAYDDTGSGMYMAAGTAGGLVTLYDIRSSKPLYVQEHKHGMPINTIKFHSSSGCILSSDEKLIKIWKYKSSSSSSTSNDVHGSTTNRHQFLHGTIDSNNDNNGGDDDVALMDKNSNSIKSSASALGAVVANVEGTGKITNFIVAGDEKDPYGNQSGLILCSTDQPKLQSYYIPQIGLAPRWCSFLENITEELEERDLKAADANGTGGDVLVRDGQEMIFENYKFIDEKEIELLGIENLIGTSMLRAYMHGYFIDMNLYHRIRSVANPFEYENYRKKKLKERLDAKRTSRIAPKEDSNKNRKKNGSTADALVNPELAERLQIKADGGGMGNTEKSGSNKAKKLANALLTDDRFGNLFTNPDYQIDEDDENFKLRNPSGVSTKQQQKLQQSNGRRDDMDSDDDEEDDYDEEEEDVEETKRKDAAMAGFRPVEDDDDDEDEEDDDDYSDDDSDDDGFRGGKVRGEAYDQMKKMKSKTTTAKMKDKKKDGKKSKNTKKSSKTIMYEADDDDIDDTMRRDDSFLQRQRQDGREKKLLRQNKQTMSLQDRIRYEQEQKELQRTRKGGIVSIVANKGGNKEMTFIPKDSNKNKEKKRTNNTANDGDGHNNDDDDDDDNNNFETTKRQRRGIRELGFKTPFNNNNNNNNNKGHYNKKSRR